MPPDKFIKNWHSMVIAEAEKKLGRKLSEAERLFIISREGYIALEMIYDTIKADSAQEIGFYLNSENLLNKT